MNRDEAFHQLDEVRARLNAKIPADAPAWGKRHLAYILDEQVGAARIHLQALYEQGLTVGPEFTPQPEHAPHPKYAFWLEGIRRHLQICEASLSGKPTED